MKNILHIKNIVLRLLLCACFVTLNFINASAVEATGTTTVRDPNGCTVNITIQIALDGGTEADSTAIKDALDAKLGGLMCTIPCLVGANVCAITITIVVRNYANIPAADQGKFHKITMKPDPGNPDLPSTTWLGGANATSAGGDWYAGRTAEEYLHETMHLCGLVDQYCARTRNADGTIDVERECTPPTAPCCTPEAHTGARCTSTCPGHATDIMATIATGTSADCANNIIPIVAAASLNSCPEACCPKPAPVITPDPIIMEPPINCKIITVPHDTFYFGTRIINALAAAIDWMSVVVTPGFNFTFLQPEVPYHNSIVTYSMNSGVIQFIPPLQPGQQLILAIELLTPSNGNTQVTFCNLTNSLNLTLHPANGTCNANGSIGVSIVGGHPPYSYQWSNGSSASALSGLSSGAYSVTVTDGNMLSANASASLSNPPPLILTIDSIKNITCPGGNDGYFSFTASGGTGTYTYAVTSNANVTNCCNNPNCNNGGYGNFGCQECQCLSTLPGPFQNVSAALFVITVTDANGCTASANVNITEPAPLSCGSLNGTPTSLCTTGAGTGSYSVPSLSGMQYNWIVPAGMTIISGQGTNAIAVQWSYAAAKAGIKGNVSVFVLQSGCTNSPPTTCNLYVEIYIVKPVQPGSISGPIRVCPTDVVHYSVVAVARASTYLWSLPSGMTITNGAGSNMISVSVGASFTGGTIAVSAANSCGTSPQRSKTISLNPPNMPGQIAGQLGGFCGLTLTYSIAPVSNATSYFWRSNSGTAIGSNSGTSYTIDWTGVTGNPLIIVDALNGCGRSATRLVNASAKPAIPVAINGSTIVCTNGIYNYVVAPVIGATLYTWTLPTGAVIVNGAGTNNIAVRFGNTPASAQVIKVRAGNACGTSGMRSLTNITIAICPRLSEVENSTDLSVYPNPVKEELTVSFNAASESIYAISIIDVCGRIQLRLNGTSNQGNNKLPVTIKGIAKGVYFLILETQGIQQQVKLFVE